ncbi:MAG: TfoX/Sxy family protein [Planctomycetota bacterium]|nr:TfoX/Sxy family protein [Planctomycetota bacterium]
MAVSEQFLEYVRDQFSGLGEVQSRKMFGGAGIYLDGRFFALVSDDELYLKVDDANRPRFEQAGSHAFEPWQGHVMNGYWSVPAEVLEDRARLAEWSQHSVKIAGSPVRQRRASRRKTSTKGKRKSTR